MVSNRRINKKYGLIFIDDGNTTFIISSDKDLNKVLFFKRFFNNLNGYYYGNKLKLDIIAYHKFNKIMRTAYKDVLGIPLKYNGIHNDNSKRTLIFMEKRPLRSRSWESYEIFIHELTHLVLDQFYGVYHHKRKKQHNKRFYKVERLIGEQGLNILKQKVSIKNLYDY